MYKYTYVNLPFEYLRINYSIWTNEDNNNFNIYLFKTRFEAINYLERFYITTAVLMDINLTKELNKKIKNEDEYIIINDFILRTKLSLDRDIIPEWNIFEEIHMNKTIKHTQYELKVQEIINQIETVISLYSHDISSLVNFLKNLKIKIDYCKYTDSVYEEFIKVTDDNIYIFVDIQINNNYSSCFSCKQLKSNIQIIYLVAQPNNDNATKLCKRLMNSRMCGKVFHLKEILEKNK